MKRLTKVRQQTVYSVTDSDGAEWMRLGASNWGMWMGSSLELDNFPEETAELEAAFQMWNNNMPTDKD